MHEQEQSALIHVANVLYLASYSVRDILWLRILSVAGMLCLGFCYYACAAENPMWWNAFYWQLAFLSVNFVQIGLLIYERRPVQLTDIQKKLHAGPLAALTPRQVERFTNKATWRSMRPGEQLLAENVSLTELMLILSGAAIVRTGGRDIARIEQGQFVGEMSFLTGGKTSAEVVADEAVILATWSEKYVTELMKRDQELGTALQAALGTDLVQKLLRTRD